MMRAPKTSRTPRKITLLSATIFLAGLPALATGCDSLYGAEGGTSGEQPGSSETSGNTVEQTARQSPPQRSASASAGLSPGEWPVADVAAEVEPSVVQVNVSGVGGASGESQGSGVIYREDGYILTNDHVVAGAGSLEVALADGSTEPARVVGTDEYTDLAVLEVDRRGLPAAEFADSGGLAPGQLAVAVGNPSGFESTVTSGLVRGLGREVPSRLTGSPQPALVDLIQTDAAISPGSSGGALANAAGEVIGINVAYLPPSQTGAVNIGFAIPSSTATSVADQLIETGEATHPYLGLSLADLTPQIAEQFGIAAEQGALVVDRDSQGPLAGSGISEGSVITSLGSQKVESAAGLISALREYQPGDEVTLTVASDSKRREVTVELGERESREG